MSKPLIALVIVARAKTAFETPAPGDTNRPANYMKLRTNS